MPSKKRLQKLQQIKDAEKRALRKSQRLNKRGIVTGSIDPTRGQRAQQNMTMRELNKYQESLENYISRKSQYVAGEQGSPIARKLFNTYRKVVEAWNKKHNEYWQKWDKKHFMSPASTPPPYAKEEAQTLGELEFISPKRYRRGSKLSNLKESDIRMQIDLMNRELDPAYERRRIRDLKNNINDAMSYSFVGDDAFNKLFNTLTYNQIEALANQTDFIDRFFETLMYNHINTAIDGRQIKQDKSHLVNFIKWAKINY